MNDARRLTLAEVNDGAGSTDSRVAYLNNLGVTTRPPGGGYTVDNILEVSQALELMRAGFTGRQLQRIFAVQRAELAQYRSPAARLTALYERYIETVVSLSEIFGKGEGFDEWHTRQQQQLEKMRSELAASDRPSRRERRDDRLLRLFVAANKEQRQNAAAPLAG